MSRRQIQADGVALVKLVHERLSHPNAAPMALTRISG